MWQKGRRKGGVHCVAWAPPIAPELATPVIYNQVDNFFEVIGKVVRKVKKIRMHTGWGLGKQGTPADQTYMKGAPPTDLRTPHVWRQCASRYGGGRNSRWNRSSWHKNASLGDMTSKEQGGKPARPSGSSLVIVGHPNVSTDDPFVLAHP